MGAFQIGGEFITYRNNFVELCFIFLPYFLVIIAALP